MLQVTSAEDGAGWLAFFRDPTARGLTGVALVTSDAHAGLVTAIWVVAKDQLETILENALQSVKGPDGP